ncbi:HTH-type transcriptional regulator BetI [Ruminiclostridium hungatei]|uniref:HTH-type transcriptional regulator BetI n=1 Tax=Ruminiclostridium hungatei TaxID=48256 RepID=A0A1V4SHJ7_RUMHU|nr:TetR/AcrR family transcriptional regulator [Ruminiclostridium hungatei]OPX43348.1 HTH-type transcriptional regulator BetI [Ruminiclostridium hungatei]
MKNQDTKKKKIIDCANQIIRSEGIRAVNVTNVVNACKISKSTFYKYFSSTEDLISNIKQGADNDDEAFYSMRQMIIQKAIAEFSKNAFHTIDIDTIAKAVGLKRTSIYSYFKSKEELLEISFQNELENRKRFSKLMKQSPFHPVVYIEKILQYGVNFSTSKYNNLMMRNILYYSSVNEKIKKIWDETYSCTQEIIEEYFVQGKKEGVFSQDIETKTISQLVLSCWLGISVSKPEQYNELGKKFIDMFIIPITNYKER